ncbi:helix-hairpin-helix domain-containing protein [Aureibaculum sp. A20]|uniref:Helix-hairpin-helix domain-containing protein n=1 Tax=Aureibaculum flavum TaxID=2795986 RepID=A0ABS0WUZ0_9FLAO|nr:helix-hairpin-helix domain-containing protein [Aureibaculum flavum]MBJ2175794.1 helix-hairpin-helix domain-containing protein [Aureibaculum flavum]
MKSHFWFNKSQRNGIFFLVLIIITLQLIYFFVIPKFENKDSIDTMETIQIQHKIDSIKEIKIAEKENKSIPKIYPFNPSYLNDAKGYQLGMNPNEIDRLLAHRSAGKFVNSTKQFQEITKISDSLLGVIAPYFKFPDWITNPKKNANHWEKKEPAISSTADNSTPENKNKAIVISDLNSVTAEDLRKISGIGEKLAKRIIDYRKKLSGFSFNTQLYEVYYLDKEVADKVLLRYKVLSKPSIAKIDVNTATFKEVLSIVYIDYELTKKIFEYRDEVAEIQLLEELKKIPDFPTDKFDRIALYLEVK